MADERVLRVRRLDASDDDSSFVLLKITRTGSHALDLRIVGTEGEYPFIGTVKQSQVRKLRAANYQGTDAEWEAVLKWALLLEAPETAEAKLVEAVETVASVGGDGQISITVRKNISGITQRLGSITLTQNDEEEISPLDWAGIAAQATADAVSTVASLRSKLVEQQETITKLNAQLEDFIKAKQEQEDVMLQKFTQLLNSKKLKIRDQQRLLAGAKIDSSRAEEVSESRKPASSRRSKRKVEKAQSEDGDSDGFETAAASKMDVDQQEAEAEDEDDDEVREVVTPELSDETADEDEEEPPPRPLGSKGKAPAKGPPQQSEEALEPPPPRELPFTRKDLRSKKPEAPPEPIAAPADNDDDETDEEL
ncbi:hypothetical protein NA57DRAFT_57752 [Rhizodiscina lignyota]|uniref:Uncharacterized protein n=1 Tax=Rhizodiscina lignyota TaxID=1504668 RepID=A0A9P4M7A5_9PEZI|nr:hypothetical protein NA57DRAFT_57752 [Rhizodiscina lignyota]